MLNRPFLADRVAGGRTLARALEKYRRFYAIGSFYSNFAPVEDSEVVLASLEPIKQ